MSEPKITNLVEGNLGASTNTYLTRLELPWVLAHGLSTAFVMDRMQNSSTDYDQIVRWRFASVLTTEPGSWTDAASGRTSDGVGTQSVDLSGTTNKLWVQFGLAAKSSSTGEGFSSLRAAFQGNAKIIASTVVQVNPTLNSTYVAYIPLGDLIPALDLTGLMFAFVVSGVNGTVTYRPAWRYFTSIEDTPSTWTDLGSGDESTSTDGTNNPGNISITPGTAMFAQPGLKITSTTARATIQVIVSAKW